MVKEGVTEGRRRRNHHTADTTQRSQCAECQTKDRSSVLNCGCCWAGGLTERCYLQQQQQPGGAQTHSADTRRRSTDGACWDKVAPGKIYIWEIRTNEWKRRNISPVFLCSLSRLFRWIWRSVNMISRVHVTADRSDCLLTSQLHSCMANKNPVNV